VATVGGCGRCQIVVDVVVAVVVVVDFLVKKEVGRVQDGKKEG